MTFRHAYQMQESRGRQNYDWHGLPTAEEALLSDDEGPTARWFSLPAVVMAVIALWVVAAFVLTATLQSEVTVTGVPRAAEIPGPSDEDQIRDVLQAISDAYNRKDVLSAEDSLCYTSRTQWNPQLRNVWMAYRLRHGALTFTVDSVDVQGVVAHVSGTQEYANDVRAQPFTAEMGRSPHGWRMCSST